MINPELEEKIKKTKEFMELWLKFHELYTGALKKEAIHAEEEMAFLETKSLIARKYQALMDRLGMEPSMDDKTFDVVSQLLSLQGVSSISDVQIQEIETGWHRSFMFLNKLLGTLENQKETLARISPLSIWIPRVKAFLAKKRTRFILFVIIFILLANGFRLGEKVVNFPSALRVWEYIQGFFPVGTK